MFLKYKEKYIMKVSKILTKIQKYLSLALKHLPLEIYLIKIQLYSVTLSATNVQKLLNLAISYFQWTFGTFAFLFFVRLRSQKKNVLEQFFEVNLKHLKMPLV